MLIIINEIYWTLFGKVFVRTNMPNFHYSIIDGKYSPKKKISNLVLLLTYDFGNKTKNTH